jgi:hypothetical protein
MSSESSSSYDVPVVEPTQMTRWKKLFTAFLDTKNCSKGLREKPVLSQRVLRQRQGAQGQETERSRQYRAKVTLRAKQWKKKDRKVYGYLVKSCKANESAMEIILDEANERLTARELLVALEARFSRGQIVGVVQAKLAAFNTMEITPGETVESFINRILAGRRELRELGCEYIDKDVFCLGRLKDALLKDPRFEATALSLQVNPQIDWEEAVRVLTAMEATSTRTNTTVAATAAESEVVRRLRAQVASAQGRLKKYEKTKKENKNKDVKCF